MLKKVKLKETYFHEIYQLFGYDDHEELETRRSRLFPVGNSDSETSTTSIFLATMSAVKEYRELLLTSIGFNKIKNKNIQLHTYTEISNSEGDRPDGLIVVTSGKNKPIVEWMCFVESKVDKNTLDNEQVNRYIDFARDIGMDSVITISNQLSTTPYDSPMTTKKKFNLYHWSWVYLKVMSSRLINTNSIEDEDHIYILNEYRRYCDTHKKLTNFINMGKDWKDCVANVHAMTPDQKIDSATIDCIIDAYKQEEKDIGLQLTDASHSMVEMLLRKDRTEEVINSLNSSKTIITEYSIDGDKHKTFFIEVNFMKQSIKCFTNIIIEKGKAQAQTSGLIKMFENSGITSSIIIVGYYQRKKHVEEQITLQKLIDEKTKAEQYSIVNKDLGDEIKSFEVQTFDAIGRNFSSSKQFITSLESLASRFLTQVMENIK